VKSKERDFIHQLATYRDHVKRYDVMIPNCFTQHDNEADLFCIRKSGLCDEFEIKQSRSDLLSDKKKIVSVERCSHADFVEWRKANHTRPKGTPSINQRYKHEALQLGLMDCNYFWYVIKEGIGGEGDIPDFAGLIVIGDSLEVVKWPKKLKKEKLTFERRYQLATKLSSRFWRLEIPQERTEKEL
jgi:hypothetical protein